MNTKTKSPICVNFYAGPGTGKSTVAAEVYASLKKQHINCELITEFAKRKVWEGNTKCLDDQLYITAKQNYVMNTVANHVDVIVTDSPLLLGAIYGNDDLLNQIINREYNKYDNIDIFLVRNLNNGYQNNGRMQSIREAIQKDGEINEYLHSMSDDVIEIDMDSDVITHCMDVIQNRLRIKKAQ